MSDLKKHKVSLTIERYNMSRRKLGTAVIFNNESFDDEDLKKRRGTEKDGKEIRNLLQNYGFQTELYQDLDQIEAVKTLKKLSERNYREESCFVAVFLSHGESDRILMRNGQLDVQKDILDRFRGNKCPSLGGKPKIFIIQACRGFKAEDPAWDLDEVDSCVQVDALPESVKEEGVCVVTPAGADFIVCYAAANGYVSYRDLENGSWFIENFVAVMGQYMKDPDVAELDFASLMTVVARNVARKKDYDKRGKRRLQIPCTVSTLKKRIFFPRAINQTSTQIEDNSDSDYDE